MNNHEQDAYTIKRFGQIGRVAGKIRQSYVKKAVGEGNMIHIWMYDNINTTLLLEDMPHFLEYAAGLANALRDTIFVDQVWTLTHSPTWPLTLDQTGCISVYSEKRGHATYRRAYNGELG